jgi:hypothetical protein
VLLRIELYGCLKDGGLGDFAEVEVAPGSTARQALEALSLRLGKRAVLAQAAVLATDSLILRPEEEVPADARLAALPPVCGG